jgi:hypothetical protein
MMRIIAGFLKDHGPQTTGNNNQRLIPKHQQKNKDVIMGTAPESHGLES